MTDKEVIIKGLRKLIAKSDEEKEQIKEEKFVDINGKDGVVFRVSGDELVEGVEVGIVNEDGSVDLTPNADYVLEDGTTFSTDDESKVMNIVQPEGEVEEELEDETEVKKEDLQDELTERVKNLEKMVNGLVSQAEELKKDKQEMSKYKEEISKKIVELSKEPAENEVKITKTGYQIRKEERQDKTDLMIERLRKVRN